jgi:hypothetical protein
VYTSRQLSLYASCASISGHQGFVRVSSLGAAAQVSPLPVKNRPSLLQIPLFTPWLVSRLGLVNLSYANHRQAPRHR